MWKQSTEGAKGMRRTMLAVVSVATCVVLLMLFGVYILWQCTPVWASTHPDSILQFPCMVEGTELRALQLASYEGIFLEDTSDREVVNTAALVLENSGSFLKTGAVVLEIEDARLVFELFDLPPEGRVLVLEKDGNPFVTGELTGCYGWELEWYPEDMGHITAEDAGGMCLAVTNQTDSVIPVARVCYRMQDPGSGMFLGGISRSIEIRDLWPGERRVITPPYYASGSSKILYVTTWVEE